MLSQNVRRLAITKIGCGLDGLNWKTVRSMLEVIFRSTGIEIMVCSCNHKRSPAEKSVDCYFFQKGNCRNETLCKFRHEKNHSPFRDEMVLRRGQCSEAREVLERDRRIARRAPLEGTAMQQVSRAYRPALERRTLGRYAV